MRVKAELSTGDVSAGSKILQFNSAWLRNVGASKLAPTKPAKWSLFRLPQGLPEDIYFGLRQAKRPAPSWAGRGK
jgi:hypothetical protein